MARKQGGSIYVSTDPNNIIPVGTPGVGISIGRLGTLLYAGTDESILTPSDGDTITVVLNGNVTDVILESTVPLFAALTFVFPSGVNMGDIINVYFAMAVTTLSWSANVNPLGPPPFTLPAATLAKTQYSWAWNSFTTQWNRIA